MEIEYDFEMNDWVEFQKNHLQNSKQFKRTKLIVSLMLPLIFSILIIFDLIKGEFNPVGWIIYSMMSLLWVLYYPKRMMNRTLDKARKMMEEGDNSGIVGHHKLILDDDGIMDIGPDCESKIKWNGIKKIVETEGYYFLYNTALSAIIIPKTKIEKGTEQLDKLLKAKVA